MPTRASRTSPRRHASSKSSGRASVSRSGNIRGDAHVCGARRAAEQRPPGRPTLGFLNPLLYKCGENAFKEVIDGANPGCGTPGFKATKGWAPVTGLGTPDFKKLMKVCVR
ncbi:hypothetical protein B0H14DRAFT_3867954 [Mycena olivaceomarginata]|nr:hypothetical protein B0H14DRAFT_3867954 [Mycena olivaceomarginata]